MSTIHGVALLADQRYEAPIIQAIQARSDTLAIVRRCADLAEVIAAARAGVADLAIVGSALVKQLIAAEDAGTASLDGLRALVDDLASGVRASR